MAANSPEETPLVWQQLRPEGPDKPYEWLDFPYVESIGRASVGLLFDTINFDDPQLPQYLAKRGVRQRRYMDTSLCMVSVNDHLTLDQSKPYIRAMKAISNAEIAKMEGVPRGSADEAKDALLNGTIEMTRYISWVDKELQADEALRTAQEGQAAQSTEE